jgi:hypothetical protein
MAAQLYHNRYDTYDFIRGQEGDPWKAMVKPRMETIQRDVSLGSDSEQRRNKLSRNIINREHIKQYEDFPSVRCFDAGLEFLNTNQKADNWLLHLETFDPHEPFHAPEEFRKKFSTNYKGCKNNALDCRLPPRPGRPAPAWPVERKPCGHLAGIEEQHHHSLRMRNGAISRS